MGASSASQGTAAFGGAFTDPEVMDVDEIPAVRKPHPGDYY